MRLKEAQKPLIELHAYPHRLPLLTSEPSEGLLNQPSSGCALPGRREEGFVDFSPSIFGVFIEGQSVCDRCWTLVNYCPPYYSPTVRFQTITYCQMVDAYS